MTIGDQKIETAKGLILVDPGIKGSSQPNSRTKHPLAYVVDFTLASEKRIQSGVLDVAKQAIK